MSASRFHTEALNYLIVSKCYCNISLAYQEVDKGEWSAVEKRYLEIARDVSEVTYLGQATEILLCLKSLLGLLQKQGRLLNPESIGINGKMINPITLHYSEHN